MEANGTGIGRLDNYEDMFKEITRKLYGDDPDHRTSNVQNEFEASVTFKAEEPFKVEDDGAATDASDDANSWILDDEPLKGTDGSRVAAYRPDTSTWRCYECGDSISGGAREVAEHFYGLHGPQVNESRRNKAYRRGYSGLGDIKFEEIVTYLERVRERADRPGGLPTCRTQETQTVPAVLQPVTPSFLIHDLPLSVSPQQVLQPQLQQQQHHQPQHQQTNLVSSILATETATMPKKSKKQASSSSPNQIKRYKCDVCTYNTDRRDLYTRHMNIHEVNKPFACYACVRFFSRADHVKKHFQRMHKELVYDPKRIRTKFASSLSPSSSASSSPSTSTSSLMQQQQQQPQQQPFLDNNYQMQQPANGIDASALYAAAAANVNIMIQQQQQQQQPEASVSPQQAKRMQNGNGKSKGKSTGGSPKNDKPRVACNRCSWTGNDNWCLKRHRNTHTKPYPCKLCEYRAARAERLTNHILKVHRRYYCSKCRIPFETKDQLISHVKESRCKPVADAAAAAAVAAASVAGDQHQPNATISALDQSNEQQQPQAINGGGRAPPGPPVFPASSAAIAPATMVIPPTTILGDSASPSSSECSSPGSPSSPTSECSSPGSPSYDQSFQQRYRRSRKQNTPRKAITSIDMPIELIHTPIGIFGHTVRVNLKKKKSKIPKHICYLCPDKSYNRDKGFYHKGSLMMHRMWRHNNPRLDSLRSSTVSVTSETLTDE